MHQLGVNGFKDALSYFCEELHRKKKFPVEIYESGVFSYVLTKKQKNRIQAICKERCWPKNQSQGVTVYVKDINHVLKSRIQKDQFTWGECAELMFLAYSPQSEIAFNDHKDSNHQTFILNAKKRFMVKDIAKYGGVILEVSKNNLAQVTCYDASRAKVNKILSR